MPIPIGSRQLLRLSLGVTAVDYMTSQELRRGQNGHARGWNTEQDRKSGKVQVTQAITINRPVNEVYGFWRNFENLPRFMDHLESVQVLDDRRSHWKAKAPAGMSVEWDAEIIDDRPDELIAWRSLQDADVRNSGSVRFSPAPGERGTEILVELRYDPPGGISARRSPSCSARSRASRSQSDLRRFKQVMETGEVVQSDASIHKGPHPARPPQPARSC